LSPGPDTIGHDRADAAAADPLRTTPLELIDGLESLVGANGEPMLFDAASGRYTRLSASGVRVVGLFDGARTGDDLIALLARGDGEERARRERSVLRFLAELRQAGLLTLPAADEDRRQRAARAAGRELLWRKPLVRDVGSRLEPAAALLRRVPLAPLLATLALLLVTCAALVVVTLSSGLPDPAGTLWPVVIALLLMQLAVHETSHALVSRFHGLNVREAGIGLLFYFWPIAYVDRTDAYRLRERSKRASIVLAGPASDLLFAGTCSLVALLTHGDLSDTARTIVLVECFGIMATFNPLLPSDGYHAIEAASGELNLRSRAFSYLGHRMTRVPAPSALAAVSARRARFYLLFGVACVAYVCVLCGGMLVTLLGWFGEGPLS
jgi:putative peptide zinc metalloprotease protein